MRFTWNAYWELANDRVFGPLGVPGAIPFTAIDRYAARYEISDRDDFTRFHSLLRRMDSAFIAHMAEKHAAEGGK